MGLRRHARKLTLVITLVATMGMGSAASTTALLAGVSTSPSGRTVTAQVTEEFPFIATTAVKDSHDRYANLAGISTSPSGPVLAGISTSPSLVARDGTSNTLRGQMLAGISTSPSDPVPAIADVSTGESAGRRSHGAFTL